MTVRKKSPASSFQVDFTNVRVWRKRIRVRSDRFGGRRRYMDYNDEYWRELDDLTAAEHHYGWGRD